MAATFTKKRVVVTGMGAVSPLGSTLETLWANLMAGKSGMSKITNFADNEITVDFGASIPDFEPTDYMDKRDVRRMDRYMQFGVAATKLAMEDSGLAGKVEPRRFGVVLSTGAGGIGTIQSAHKKALTTDKAKGFDPYSKLAPLMFHQHEPLPEYQKFFYMERHIACIGSLLWTTQSIHLQNDPRL